MDPARIIRWPLKSDNGKLTGLLKEANHKVKSRDWYGRVGHHARGGDPRRRCMDDSQFFEEPQRQVV